MLSHDPDFLQRLQAQLTAHAAFTRAETWYSEAHPGKLERGVAFFCMEYGLSESLPLYSGGLGVLAGDYLKAASDPGRAVTAVGLLYQQGYFRQAISADGEQLEFYPYNDPTMLPLSPLRDEDDGWLRVTVPLPGRDVRLRAWIGQVGRCELLLLDSNDPRNEPGDRGITSELYSGDPEKRLQQEMMLGIGGWRLLRKLKRDPAVCHINEGHCALALVERALSWGRDNERDFETARSATRVSNLFTTHTSVAAGFDRFPRRQLELYLAPWLAQSDLSVEQLVALGVHDDDRDATGDPLLNMGRLALAMSGRVNAVSRIHQQVSQTIFQPFFPRWPRQDIPVEYVTNGVHTPSWDSPESDELWTGACGQDRWCRPMETLEPLAEVSRPDTVAHAPGAAQAPDPLPPPTLGQPALCTPSRWQYSGCLRPSAGQRDPDPGICPALYRVQTSRPAVERRGSLGAAAQPAGPAGADRPGGQGPPPRPYR